MPRVLASHSLWISLGLIALVTALVASRPAFRQKKNEVAIRMPGERLLRRPQAAQQLAAEDFPYALISCSAYDPPVPKAGDVLRCPQAASALGAEWTPWVGFPDQHLQSQMDGVHLRARVWQNRSANLLVVAFGGTVASNWKDWVSNTHWIHSSKNDEYSVTGGAFAEEFAKELAQRIRTPGGAYLGGTQLISTGHSLGAGLAEKFAYSLPADACGIQKVKAVYAFDATPVTTYLNTAHDIREENKMGLEIFRIYERGEILAILRSITSLVHPPPKANPIVMQRRYNLFGGDRFGLTNPVGSHSINQLAFGLKALASERALN